MGGAFDTFLGAPAALAAFEAPAVVAAMLRFEAALAAAQAAEGLIAPDAAAAIAAACDPQLHDAAAIAAASTRAGSLAIPMVQSLRSRVAAPHGAAAHLGATSQDAIDTACALVSQPVLAALRADVLRCVAALRALAQAHAATPMLARTLGQPASVTTFGWKCAQWAAPLRRAVDRLDALAADALALQLGGAVGTLGQMQGRGGAVAARVAHSLGLALPPAPWHTQRDRWVALGCGLGVLAGSLGKLARDLSLLGQWEVGEVAEPAEPGRGGSSAMPHKQNPVAAMVALAAAQRAPQRVAALLAAMPQEHERGLGNWQAELAEWPGLLAAVHGSAAALAPALEGLRVDAARMRRNLDALGATLPPDAAAEWFDPALARHAQALADAALAEWPPAASFLSAAQGPFDQIGASTVTSGAPASRGFTAATQAR